MNTAHHLSGHDGYGSALRGRPTLPNTQTGEVSTTVVVAEDDRDMRDLLAWSLRKRGHEVLECASGAALLELVDAPTEGRLGIDLIISDVRMPELTGLEALKRIRSRDQYTPLIVMTAFPEVETRVAASELGVAALFTKPFEIGDLCTLVDRILALRSRRHGRPSSNGRRSIYGDKEE